MDKRMLSQLDWVLLLMALLLTLAGITTIYGATHAQGQSFHERQFYWLMISLVIIIPVIAIDYSLIERFSYLILAAVIVLLIAVLVIGKTVNNAKRWIPLGPIAFQPSEFAKIAVIIALARHLSSKNVPRGGLDFKDLIMPVLIAVIPFVLIAKQPDLGTALIIAFISASMALIVKVRPRVIVAAAIGLAVMMPIAWHHLKPYQKARLSSFIDPSAAPRGSGYHLSQSKIAIGSGGVFGKGFMKGTQGSLEFLPEHHTDFIFAVLAEEWGFAGAAIVLSLLAVLVMRGVDIASHAKDRFGFLLAFGVTAMLFWHAAINTAMVMGLLPVVGVPLPFISYGGSFLMSMYIGIGILLSISMRKFIF